MLTTIKINGKVKKIRNCLNCPFFIWNEDHEYGELTGYVSCGCSIKDDDTKTISVYKTDEYSTPERPKDCPIIEIKETDESTDPESHPIAFE